MPCSPWRDSFSSSLKMAKFFLSLKMLKSLLGFLRYEILEISKILYVFSKVDMMGLPIYHFTHPSDQKKMQSKLSKRESELSTPSHSPSPSPPTSCKKSTNLMALDVLSCSNASGREEKGPRQSFYIQMREKPLTKHDNSKYEHMHIVGHLRKTEDSSLGKYTFVGVMRPMRDRYTLKKCSGSCNQYSCFTDQSQN